MALKLMLLFLSFVSILYASSICKIRHSSGSRDEIANQTCDGTSGANSEFYCPYDGKCKARSLRCVGANVCNNPATNKEEGCHETSTPGEYKVLLGHVKLFDSSPSKRKRSWSFDELREWFHNHKLEHQFIEYRGFTYEFGCSGVQILDTADPKYIYKNSKKFKSKGIEYVESSYCTWQDATKFVDGWNKKYNLWTHNCQHFAGGLIEHLTTGVCNQPLSSFVKREDRDAELDEQINQILSNCSIVCCYGSDSNDQTNIGLGFGLGLGTLLLIIVIGTVIIYIAAAAKSRSKHFPLKMEI